MIERKGFSRRMWEHVTLKKKRGPKQFQMLKKKGREECKATDKRSGKWSSVAVIRVSMVS